MVRLADIGSLPTLETGTEGQISTYDRSGGNDDGFNGTYSFIRRNPDSSLVMLDLDGPGEINRIATPTPTKDTLDFYFDGEKRPGLSICYPDLFSGRTAPFLAPLCGAGAGGYYCYFPILFSRHCTIVCRGKKLQFHQLQYRLFPAGTRVETFRSHPDAEVSSTLKKIALIWGAGGPARLGLLATPGGKSATFDQTVRPGQRVMLASLQDGGRITGISIDDAGKWTDSAADCWLHITWDGQPAIDCPVADFFGYVSGKPSMSGLLIGGDVTTAYSCLPMPFDATATVELFYKGHGQPMRLHTRIDYTRQKRDPAREGKLYAHYQTDTLLQGDPYHVFLSTNARGHYVGTILYAKGLHRPGTLFFEGDDSLATDGVFRIHGTGSEDYLNGGWYALPGRWDTTRSFPLSGCIYYSWERAVSAGYRWYDLDKIPFSREIWLGIEHGPDPAHRVDAVYRSVAFYYKQ